MKLDRTRLDRVVVVGTSGSGKTTLARALARALGSPHVELDALHWAPDWVERPDDEFAADVERAIAASRWVADGNYSLVRDRLWRRAQTLVYLDFSFPLVLYRATWRTFRRAITREELFSGNRERFWQIFDRDWIPWWVMRTYHRRRREIPEQLARPGFEHLQVLTLSRPAEAEALLAELRA